jgi:hypothetical protein
MEKKKDQEEKLPKYPGIEVLCRLLMIVACMEGFTISGAHLWGVSELILKYLDVRECFKTEQPEKPKQKHD